MNPLPVHNTTFTGAIFSLTTLPSRAKKIYPTLYSLLDQTTPIKIQIHIPEKANPEPDSKYVFPESITSHPNIKIITHKGDLGPSMKFIPAIMETFDESPKRHIISVDDDMIYPRELANKLIIAADTDNQSIHCLRGNIFKGEASYHTSVVYHSQDLIDRKQVAIVTGCGGYIIPYPVALKLKNIISDYSGAPKECKVMDDVWLSGVASRLHIRKYLIPGIGKYHTSVGSFFTPAYLNPDREKKNEVAIQYFLGEWSKEEVEK
jgi:hypothetical protein